MKVVFDKLENIINIRFGNLEDEVISEKTRDEIIWRKIQTEKSQV